jgi:hypothetical protein
VVEVTGSRKDRLAPFHEMCTREPRADRRGANRGGAERDGASGSAGGSVAAVEGSVLRQHGGEPVCPLETADEPGAAAQL